MLYWSCSMSMRSERTEYRICSNNARSSRIGHRLDGPQRMINWNQALGARREGLVSPLLVKTAHDCLLLSPGAIIVEQEAIRRSHDSFPGLNLRGERAQTRLDGAVFQHPVTTGNTWWDRASMVLNSPSQSSLSSFERSRSNTITNDLI